jgi:thymidylate synthase ThyX
VSDFGKLAFEIYEKAIKLGVPEQDARYLLPEGVLTRMIFSAPPRYLIKIANSLKNAPLKELQEIGEKIEALIKEKFGLEIPTEEPISEWKFWGREEIKEGTFLDYQGNLHSLSLNMEVKGGLSMFAQLVRQRQFLCEIEPLEQIAKRGEFAVPPSFPEKIKKDYQEIAREARKKQIELIEKKDPNFVYFLLLGQVAKAMVYGKGYGIIETSKSRSCGAAQWEIRNVVGIPITEKLGSYFELKEKIGPRCWREKRCIEPSVFKTKKQICKVFELSKGNWKETLEKLLETLKSRVKSFN